MARERLKADDAEASLLDRRSYLKMAGAAVATTAGAASSGAAATTAGFGEGEFGQVPYGGGDGGTVTESAPSIDEFTVSRSDRLGDDRMFSVQWEVSDADGDLSTVEVVVAQTATDVNFSVSQVSGSSASDYDLFQFPVGSTFDVTLRVEDSAGNVTKDTKAVSL